MKRKIIFTLSFLLVVVLLVVLLIPRKNESFKKEESVLKKENVISVMLETGVGTKEYKSSTTNDWPIDGYKFNESLSGCENSSKLLWNNDKQTILMQGNFSDKCYVYFDVNSN